MDFIRFVLPDSLRMAPSMSSSDAAPQPLEEDAEKALQTNSRVGDEDAMEHVDQVDSTGLPAEEPQPPPI